jgi:hypothetical protein
MDQLLYAVLGFLFGLFARFVYDWNLDRKEARTIRRSLLLEILYMHEATQRLLLDKYFDKYRTGQFRADDLGGSFWRPSYSTNIYESHIAKIDRLLGSDLCLQLHYYYSLVKNLNEMASEDEAQVNQDFAINYLSSTAHAYAIGNGSVECILGNPEAKQVMQDNLKFLINTFDDDQRREYVAGIVREYKQSGFADALMKSPPTRRLNDLLRRHMF